LGGIEAGPYVHGFANAGDPNQADVLLGEFGHHLPHFIGRAVGAFIVAENDFGIVPSWECASQHLQYFRPRFDKESQSKPNNP
jgi:hypothetical protein